MNAKCSFTFSEQPRDLVAPTSLQQTADDNEERFSPEVINTVRRNFYVDDVLKSVPNEDNAIHLAEQLIQLMKEGGFNLTKFPRNSRKFVATLPEKERANPALNLDLDQLPIGRTFLSHSLTNHQPNVAFSQP